ncbi:MAG: histidine kinase dimerization/phosphoacceptor domain -containing protein [Balneolales bacterium]
MSGLRAYSTMQSYWTEARKDGTIALIQYIETGEPDHLKKFDSSMQLIRDAQDLRLALMSDSPDYNTAREKLHAIHVHPRDFSSMIKVFERMNTLEHFSEAIELWDHSDLLISELVTIANELNELSSNNGLDDQQKALYLDRIFDVDNQLRGHKDIIAARLSGGTRLIQIIIIWLSVSLVGIIMLSGGLFSYRFLKNLKKWGQILEFSEQRYKSLFEHNPNAVFSTDKEGSIESGNNAFEKLTGNENENQLFNDLVAVSEIEESRKKFEKVLTGFPQSFETVCKNAAGNEISMHMTSLPIYIDGKIDGAFFIAEDISYKKYAENKIKQQLEEKIFLLSEVHDRVKNNLALMSSLLQLQEQYIQDKDAKKYLYRTISRIRSMSMVHENLYQAESFANIRVDQFLMSLGDYAKLNYLNQNTKMEISVLANPLMMNIKKAIPFGLLLNELVINIFKCVFEEVESGKMTISLKKEKNVVHCVITDHGTGKTDNFDPETTLPLGMTLVKTLIKQFKGELQFSFSDGMEAKITFLDENHILKEV